MNEELTEQSSGKIFFTHFLIVFTLMDLFACAQC